MSYRTRNFREYFAVIALGVLPGFPETQPHPKIGLLGPKQQDFIYKSLLLFQGRKNLVVPSGNEFCFLPGLKVPSIMRVCMGTPFRLVKCEGKLPRFWIATGRLGFQEKLHPAKPLVNSSRTLEPGG